VDTYLFIGYRYTLQITATLISTAIFENNRGLYMIMNCARCGNCGPGAKTIDLLNTPHCMKGSRKYGVGAAIEQ